jgi:hypothetical protein
MLPFRPRKFTAPDDKIDQAIARPSRDILDCDPQKQSAKPKSIAKLLTK